MKNRRSYWDVISFSNFTLSWLFLNTFV